jgi:tetratricopeptide (TPR) repeat protein
MGDRCRNCCGRRIDELCVDCGLSAAEDVAVHEELRRLIHPTADLLATSRLAKAMGRLLIALKLATAAFLEGPQPEVARCLRIQLLRSIGEEAAALSDAQEWVHNEGRFSAMAWAACADELEIHRKPGEAIEAYSRALDLAPNAHGVRARFARLLFGLQRYGQAHGQALTVLEHPGNREATLAALEVMAGYLELLLLRGESLAVREILEELGNRAARHPVFLCASGALAIQEQRLADAKNDLRAARKLQSDHPLVEKLESLLKTNTKGWFKW